MVGNYDAFGNDGGNCMAFIDQNTNTLEFSMIDPGHVGQPTKLYAQPPLVLNNEGNH